jgi:hypothetical protein
MRRFQPSVGGVMFATRIANGYPHDRTEGDTIQLCPTLVLVLYVFSAKNNLCKILSALGAGSFVAGRPLKVMLPFVTKPMMQVSPLPPLRIYRLRGRSSAVRYIADIAVRTRLILPAAV